MSFSFDMVVDMGVIGDQEVEIEYNQDGYGYKVLDFEVWMHDFPYAGKSTEVTYYLTDNASDMIYQDCLDNLRDRMER